MLFNKLHWRDDETQYYTVKSTYRKLTCENIIHVFGMILSMRL